MRKRYTVAGLLALGVLVLDQITKALVLANIQPWERIPVIPGFFDLVNVANRGAAFGFLNRPDLAWPSMVFGAVSILAAGLILWMLYTARDDERVYVASLGLVLGGAMGNLIDRLRFGFVVDFLDLYVGDWHWPAFNVADAAICVGAAGLAWHVLTDGRRRKES